MKPADLLYTAVGTLASSLEFDGLELVASWVEFGGLRREVQVRSVVQDDAVAFSVVDLAGKQWTLYAYDEDDYQIRSGVHAGDEDDARELYAQSLEQAHSAEGVAPGRMDKFTWSADDLAHLSIVKH